jgi:dephospho-CoA kinase
MMVVGLTGGYASGKSFVAAELERLGCYLIYADRLGHRVLEPDGEAYAPTVEAFGREILGSDGRIDRKKLGTIVFRAPELLEKLTSFVHPAVFRLEEQMLKDFRTDHPRGIAVIEAAILIETGRYKLFDRLILTVCDEATQISRGIKRDGLSAEQVRERLRKQLPVAEKTPYADYVVDTSGEKRETIRRVQAIYQDLKTLAETKQA